MGWCPRCKQGFREPADEQGDHGCPQCGVQPFPADVAEVIDAAWDKMPSAHELDAEGRFVRGTWQGMTPAEVRAEAEAFRRATE